ncbi:hypothetical protein AQUCO_05800045v1 [Aquilegia coerulea]|uniref:BHLH domain-containing protein n=1 Tax=Aquilegia coerulea TaxID=218851 RepID=A0A2G5CEF9_AQUCA|nr:hypothetical protein AQUCO_05800045v1 [Aquilegia coerulea]
MTEHKRRPASLEPAVSLSCGTRQRYKTEVPISRKEKKEIMGERVATLQQLVSPFDKTDTASVLFEAMEYIKFLHDQVKVLSAPYLLSASTREMQESALFDLRNHGLCLVPISCTLRVTRANGADIWASMKGSAL